MGAFIPYLTVALISFLSMSSILTNKVQSSVQSNLKQIMLSLENAISNLDHISQQLAFQGYIGNMLEDYLSAPDNYSRARLRKDIEAELTLVSFTNPNVGLIMYYFQNESAHDFETAGVKDGFSLERLPLLASYYGITYYGPHVSNDRFSNQYVISAMRKVALPDRDDVSVYVETGFKLTQDILESDVIGKKSLHLLLGNDGGIAYSEIPSLFPADSRFEGAGSAGNSGSLRGYFWYRETSNQGWSIVSLISKAEFNRERDQWLGQMIGVCVFLVLVSILLGWILGRMVYRPLDRFNREIRWIEQNNFRLEPVLTKIPEFDSLLRQFQGMKRQILELLSEVEQKEKRRADLEIEKLMYQINPHFLMNALNMVHWMAVANGQAEIDRLALCLNRLLYYNLGKTGKNTDLGAELEALTEYIALQKMRYDFHFKVRVDADEQVLKTEMPRFILQPLVENAIFHGLRENGTIQVEVHGGERIRVSIADDGPGMAADTVKHLLQSERVGEPKVGMGIGLNYVKRVLDSYYSGMATLDIRSAVEHGTTVTLSLPVVPEGKGHDQGARR